LDDSGTYRAIATNSNGTDIGPEVSAVVVPAGTPIITVNGVAVTGRPGEVVTVRVGDTGRVRMSTRLAGSQVRYTTDGSNPSAIGLEYTSSTDLSYTNTSVIIKSAV
jgi:hypothetical protein